MQQNDLAVGAALILHGEDPAAYEFEMAVLYKDRGVEQLKKYPWFCGFRTEAGRKVTH